MRWLQKIKVQLLLFFVVFGPGIITAVADNDAGGVATYTVAAALYGMASSFLIIPQTILLAVTQEIGARIAIVCRKGLGDLIRERYGVRISLLIFCIYFIANQGVVLQNVSGLKASLQLFSFPWQLSLIGICLLLIVTVIKFNYKKLQQIFLFMILFYLTYVLSAFLSHPDWGEVIQETFIWPQKINIFDFRFWFSRMAVMGTTITVWGQFFVSSYILDKKLTIEHLKHEKIEVFLGAIITNFFSLMMVVAVAFTLFHNNIKVNNVYEAALAIKPLAGNFAVVLFSLGLFSASLLGLTIVPLATAYVFSEMFGTEGSLDSSFSSGKMFYSFFIIQILIGLIATLFPATNLFKLTLYADYINAALLPMIFFFLIKFSESKELMGDYVSKRFTSIFVRASGIIITILVIMTFAGKIFRLY